MSNEKWQEQLMEIQAVEAATVAANPGPLDLLHRGMGLYVQGMDTATKIDASDARLVQMGFISQAFNTIYSAYCLARQGLYFQATGLIRFVYESWVTIWYLQQHPDEARRWTAPKEQNKPPKVERMLNKIQHEEKHLKKKAADHRQALNSFVHSDSLAVRYLFDQDGDQLVVRWGAEYSFEKFEGSCYAVAVWLGQMLDAVSLFVPEGNEWHKANASFTADVLAFLDDVQDRREM